MTVVAASTPVAALTPIAALTSGRPAPADWAQADGMQPAWIQGGGHGLLRVLARHKLLVGVPVLAALASGWFLTATLPRRYTAEAVLAVEARKVQFVANEVVSHLPQDNAALRTELDIIGSRSMAGHVVDALGLMSDADALAEAGEAQPVAALLGEAVGEGLRRLLSLAGRDAWPVEPARAAPGHAEVVDWLLANLKATNDNRSFTIFVSFTSTSAARAAAVANAFARNYLDEQVSQKDATTRDAATRLAEKLGEMRRNLAAAEAAVADFRRSSGLMETKGLTVGGQQISELNTQIALARAERARAEGKLQMLHQDGGATLPDVLASLTIQNLRTQLSRAEVKMAENGRNTFLLPDLQVTVASLRGQIATETGRIVGSLAREAEAARAKEASLAASLRRAVADYGDAAAETVKLNQLLREAEVSRTSYETFLARFKQAVEHEGLAVPDASLISEAPAPAYPVSPKPVAILLIAGLCGLLVGGAAAAIRERTDDRIRDVGGLGRATGTPVLGVLPSMAGGGWRGGHGSLPRPGSRSGVAVEWLRAALLASQPPRRVQVVLVTSAAHGDGKTPVCLWLAGELVRGGERVLVVNADPHRAANGASGRGGRAAPGGPPRYFVTPAGASLAGQADGRAILGGMVRLDPRTRADFVTLALREDQDWLGHGGLAGLMDAARQDYQTVILDAAPILAGADVALLAGFADVRLLAVRCGRTHWSEMMSALTTFRLCGNLMDGIVVIGAGWRDLHRGDDVSSGAARAGALLMAQAGGRA